MLIFDQIDGKGIFKNYFEHSAVGMSIITIDGRLHPNNSFCEMVGYTREELMNKLPMELTHPDDVAESLHRIDLINSNQFKSCRWEKRYIHKDGSIVWADIHTFLHRDKEGVPQYFITTSNNITPWKKAEEEIKVKNELLQISNGEKDKFFAILAHDLRSPLSSFLGLAEVMAEDLHTMTMAEIEDISKSLHVSATSLFQLLENLLEWSLLKKGNFQFHPEKIAINRIIHRSIDPVKESARRKNIDLKVDLTENYFVSCDVKLTETIFRNLISNALKYTYSGGTIVVTARPVKQEEVEVSVSDTGIGMSKELLSKLFIVNEQVSRKGTDGESSSGLGLLICKEFVEKQGGKIRAESIEGKGSTFYFTIKQAE
ncbi:MAG TPA: ATP-binding protein [Prolixibacteraceae bacterium]